MKTDELKHLVLGKLESLEFCNKQLRNASSEQMKEKYLKLLQIQIPKFIKEIKEGFSKDEK